MNVSIPGRRLVFPFLIVGLIAASVRADLTHRYSFNEGAAKDSAGKVDANLKGDAKITGGQLVLQNTDKGSDDAKLSYLEFSGPILPKTGSVSIVLWFTAKDTGGFARLVNIGDKEGSEGRAFIYFTPKNGDGQSRAAITATDTASKTLIDGDALDDGKEHCVAIVIDGTAKKLHVFVDGKEPAAAQDLGENMLDKVRQVNNWIGKSSFDQDPGLSASINEFRVYDEALTLEKVGAIQKAGADKLP